MSVNFTTPIGVIAIGIGGISSALYAKTNSLWICVMTYSLINVFSQLAVGGNQYVIFICRIVIIAIAIILSNHERRKVK